MIPPTNLTDEERALVKSTTDGVGPEFRDKIIGIHEEQLARNKRRLAELQREVEAVERAIAMRDAALLLLRNPRGEQWTVADTVRLTPAQKASSVPETEAEMTEQVKRWGYYLGVAIVQLERQTALVNTLVANGYDNPCAVLREIQAHLGYPVSSGVGG